MAGRPKSSAVHDYFKNLSDGTALCQIKDDEGTICGAIIKSAAYPTNKKYHLTQHHHKVAEKVKSLDDQSKKKNRKAVENVHDPQQPTITSCFGSKYKTTSIEYKKRSEAVALYLGGTTTTIATVENPLFRNMLSTFDHRYSHFGRKKATQLIQKLRRQLNQKIIEMVMDAKKINITTDLWTKCDNTPFMGVTAHFYSRKDRCRKNIMIGLKVLPHPHTAANIFDKIMEILQFWGIPYEKVFKVVTDNASNMVKAFRVEETDGNGEISNDDGSDESDSDDDEEIVAIDGSHESLAMQHEDSEEENAEFRADFNLDESFLEDDEVEFDQLQAEQHELFSNKHFRCVVHSLQLVVKEILKKYKTTISAAIKVVGQFGKSSKSTLRLKELTNTEHNGIGVKRYCRTRWSSLYQMIERLLKIQNEVNKVCVEMKLSHLQPNQWITLEKLSILLEPFADHTAKLQKNSATTISDVVLAVRDLKNYLTKVSTKY